MDHPRYKISARAPPARKLLGRWNPEIRPLRDKRGKSVRGATRASARIYRTGAVLRGRKVLASHCRYKSASATGVYKHVIPSCAARRAGPIIQNFTQRSLCCAPLWLLVLGALRISSKLVDCDSLLPLLVHLILKTINDFLCRILSGRWILVRKRGDGSLRR